ncbi:hypothetical protein ACFQZZ_17210 [Nocardia sp. GCM10030253]|uniref:hypothetical protein n=1 Tax=Nocardia sp. GCM10030253 TaxID=3273404 RepID=UPI00363DBA81
MSSGSLSVPIGGRPVGTGSAERPLLAADPEVAAASVSSAETLGLDQGSVELACTGSAAVGATGVLLGLATGSGTGSALIGSGSSGGSGLGSVVVGSAATGSALLTCLLLLPGSPPPAPGIPLLLAPPPVIPQLSAVTEPAPEPAAAPPITVDRPVIASSPWLPHPTTAEPTADAIPWNVLELMALLVVTVFAVRSRSTGDRSRCDG